MYEYRLLFGSNMKYVAGIKCFVKPAVFCETRRPLVPGFTKGESWFPEFKEEIVTQGKSS